MRVLICVVSVVNDSLKSVFIGLMGYATFNKTFHVQQENRVEKRVDKENGDSHEGWDSGVRNDGTVHMKRQIGLFGGIAMIIGTMIGNFGLGIETFNQLTHCRKWNLYITHRRF